ncbi:uncharacterized protein LOC120338811 isoform X1 [Styela clava]
MALLTGKLYSKNTLGRSLFKDLAENATILPTDNRSKKETSNKPEVESETSKKNSDPTESEKIVNTENDNTEDNSENTDSAEVKVIWKQTAGKTKRPPKDFFTPQEESGDAEADHEKELNLESEKKSKKRTPVTTQPLTLNINLKTAKPPHTARAQISNLQAVRAATGVRYPQKSSQPKEQKSKTESKQDNKDEQECPENEKLEVEKVKESESKEEKLDQTVEEVAENRDLQSAEIQNYDDQPTSDPDEPTMPTLEPIMEEPIEENSDDSSSEYKSVKSESQSKKPVVIKVVPPSKYAEKLRALLAVEGQPPEALEVLQPDAIVNLKRELARKGIIESYSDELDAEERVAIEEDVFQNLEKEVSETSSEVLATAESGVVEGDLDLDELKDDKRDGYKTNKSFEIRRLQAKAEREREEKRRIFPKPRFLKGSKVSNAPSSNNTEEFNEMRSHGRDHRKNWVRRKPKSILKMQSSDTANNEKNQSDKKKEKRKSATVRIREPEYDYKLFSGDESNDSSDTVPSQSSSVLGYRPNSATSLSTNSTSSFMDDDDVSFDSSYFEHAQHEWEDDENAFYRTSALGMTVHDIYDDIDRLNPSRLTNARLPESPEQQQDNLKKNRVTSAEASLMDRSSLHALRNTSRNQRRGRPTASRSSARYPSAIRHYEDKPLHMFDAMRYENDRRHLQHHKSNRNISRESAHFVNRNQDRMLSRESRISPQSKGVSFTDGAIAFGPHMAPISKDIPSDVTETEWVDRVQKFMATAYAGKKKQDEQRKHLRKTNFAQRFLSKIKGKKKKKKLIEKPPDEDEIIMPAICYCECCPSCCFVCLPDSLCSMMIILFVPTIILMTCVLLAIFWATGIFPL